MKKSTLDLPGLLASIDPDADLAQRHLWLIHLVEWIRAPQPSAEHAVMRVDEAMEAFEADLAAQHPSTHTSAGDPGAPKPPAAG